MNGHKQPYLRNSRFEASRAAKLLSAAAGIFVPVVPGIVLVVVASVRVAGTPDGVAVLQARQLTRWLAEYPRVFDQAAVDRVFAARSAPRDLALVTAPARIGELPSRMASRMFHGG